MCNCNCEYSVGRQYVRRQRWVKVCSHQQCRIVCTGVCGVLPCQVTLDLREWVICERLYPPGIFASGVYHDLLAGTHSIGPAFNSADLFRVAAPRQRNAREFDGWTSGRSLEFPPAAGIQETDAQ